MPTIPITPAFCPSGIDNTIVESCKSSSSTSSDTLLAGDLVPRLDLASLTDKDTYLPTVESILNSGGRTYRVKLEDAYKYTLDTPRFPDFSVVMGSIKRNLESILPTPEDAMQKTIEVSDKSIQVEMCVCKGDCMYAKTKSPRKELHARLTYTSCGKDTTLTVKIPGYGTRSILLSQIAGMKFSCKCKGSVKSRNENLHILDSSHRLKYCKACDSMIRY